MPRWVCCRLVSLSGSPGWDLLGSPGPQPLQGQHRECWGVPADFQPQPHTVPGSQPISLNLCTSYTTRLLLQWSLLECSASLRPAHQDPPDTPPFRGGIVTCLMVRQGWDSTPASRKHWVMPVAGPALPCLPSVPEA